MKDLTQREQIAKLLADNPVLKERKNRFVLVSKILEMYNGMVIEPKDCQLICSLADEYRHQTKADKVGLALEEEWKRSPAQAQTEQDWNSVFKKQFNNPLA